jgi:hypothetical protein
MGAPAAENTDLTLVINSGPTPSPGIIVTTRRPQVSMDYIKPTEFTNHKDISSRFMPSFSKFKKTSYTYQLHGST